MEPSRIILWVTVLVIVTCLCYTALAKTVNGVGTHSFGADITENESCSRARIKAEADATEKAFGSTIGSTDWKMCNNETCDWRSISWSDAMGHVIEVESETRIILENPRQCRVSIIANVEELPIISPNFHIDISLSSVTYNHGDHMKIYLDPSKLMNVYVFTWAEGFGFDMLWQGKIGGRTTLPEEGYNYVTYLDEGTKNNRSKEMIVVIASTKKLNFKLHYDKEEFIKLSQRHLRNGAIVHRISYDVVQ